MTGREISVTAQLAALFPDGWDQIAATVSRLTGDRGLAEECTQDAFARALARWPVDGIPDKPLAWLVRTARNRALDQARRAQVEAAKLRLLAEEPLPEVPDHGHAAVIPDDQLEMMFTCAHPVLSTEAQIALILSALTSLSTTEIADAFLISERALRQRLFRAKQRLRDAGTPLTPAPRSALPRRLPAILHVLYVLFNAGYEGIGESGPVHSACLDCALAMGRVLTALLPGEPEAQGLLALMLLHHARRDAHAEKEDEGNRNFMPLAEQDRSRWDYAEVAEGLDLVNRLRAADRPGPFQVRAAIAACHARAATAAETDWRLIARLYAELARVTPRPSVMPCEAFAVAMADSPEAGVLLINGTAADAKASGGNAESVKTGGSTAGAGGRRTRYLLPPATRASLLRRARRMAEAVDAYREALDLAAPIALARAELTSR